MHLIPVIDVLHGQVVRGVAGRRSEYRPIVSRLTTSTNPIEVARALIDALAPRQMYLADLDAIQGSMPAFEMYRQIRDHGVELWIDAGIAGRAGAAKIAEADCHVIAGLETVPGVEALREIVAAVGASRVIFSLDLRDGVPMRDWYQGNAFDIAGLAVAAGITRLIVLDLARVGVGCGTGTDDICRAIASTFPQVEVIAGGGVSSRADLARLETCGVRGVLVASALHDGRL